MKQNVDLTENSIFSKKHSFKIILSEESKKFPWSFNKDYSSSHNKDRTLFPVGDITKVKKFKEFQKTYYSNEICDCCGKPLSKAFWKNSYFLCEECYNYLYLKYDNISWKFKTDSEHYKELVNRSQDRIVIELNWRDVRGLRRI